MILDSNNCSTIVDNLYDGLYIVDLSGIIQYWNKAAEKISGYTASEVIGSSCSDNILAHVDDRGENLCRKMCPLTKTMADGQAREAQVYLHHKKGHMVPVSAGSSATIVGKPGQQVCYLTIILEGIDINIDDGFHRPHRR